MWDYDLYFEWSLSGNVENNEIINLLNPSFNGNNYRLNYKWNKTFNVKLISKNFLYRYSNLLDKILKTTGINLRVDFDGEYSNSNSFYMQNNTFILMLERPFIIDNKSHCQNR